MRNVLIFVLLFISMIFFMTSCVGLRSVGLKNGQKQPTRSFSEKSITDTISRLAESKIVMPSAVDVSHYTPDLDFDEFTEKSVCAKKSD